MDERVYYESGVPSNQIGNTYMEQNLRGVQQEYIYVVVAIIISLRQIVLMEDQCFMYVFIYIPPHHGMLRMIVVLFCVLQQGRV